MTTATSAALLRSPLAHVTPEFAAEGHAVWVEIRPRAGKPGFVAGEFNRPHAMDAHFLRLLYRVRLWIVDATRAANLPDVSMVVISDARPVGGDTGADRSTHKKRPCRSVDLQVYNAYDRAVLTIAGVRHGIVRWGTYPGERVSDEWRDKAGFHLDASDHADNPSPGNWTRH